MERVLNDAEQRRTKALYEPGDGPTSKSGRRSKFDKKFLVQKASAEARASMLPNQSQQRRYMSSARTIEGLGRRRESTSSKPAAGSVPDGTSFSGGWYPGGTQMIMSSSAAKGGRGTRSGAEAVSHVS